MRCVVCQKEEAKIHITQVKENQKQTVHLCHECAQELGLGNGAINTSFSIEDLLMGKTAAAGESSKGGAKVHSTCPNCGLSYGAFMESGRLGCSVCYETFTEQLLPLLRKVQKDIVHRGKKPVKGDTQQMLKREISDMRLQLKNAVTQENFEEAARLRDTIRHLELDLEQAFQANE